MSSADPSWPVVANVSLLYRELPFLDRFAAAGVAGFELVECWWPFASAVPGDEELNDFVRAIADAGLQLTGLNLFAGDMPGGERGILSRPDRLVEFVANLDAVERIATLTGCRGFNALYGQRAAGLAGQDEAAIEHLALAARRFASFGGVLFVEALARGLNGAYPIETADQAVDVVREARLAAGGDGIAFLFDTFHLASNGEDLVDVVARTADLIGHVQLADAPGRGEPGSGTIDFGSVFAALAAADYRGLVALEYVSTTAATTVEWLGAEPHLTFRA